MLLSTVQVVSIQCHCKDYIFDEVLILMTKICYVPYTTTHSQVMFTSLSGDDDDDDVIFKNIFWTTTEYQARKIFFTNFDNDISMLLSTVHGAESGILLQGLHFPESWRYELPSTSTVSIRDVVIIVCYVM
jgi:hypothetical protein